MQYQHQVLVTGAGGGVGAAVVRRFVEEGCRVIAVDRDAEAMRRKLGALAESAVMPVIADLEDQAQMSAIRAVVDGIGAGLSAAAFCHGGCVIDSTPFPGVDFWDANYRHNVKTSINALGACADVLRRASGNLVIISSVDAILSLEGAAPYDAAKASLLSMVKGISRAYSPEICAIALVLGTVATGAWREILEANPKAFDQMGNMNLAGKVISPDEVAGLVWLLTRPEARIMRGQSVVADNGWSFLAGTFQFDSRRTPK